MAVDLQQSKAASLSEPLFVAKQTTAVDSNQNSLDNPALSSVDREKAIREMWAKEKLPWASRAGGRLAIRAFSRGVVGAAFYTWGARKAREDMTGYEIDKKPANSLQYIARFFDVAVSKPLENSFAFIWRKQKNGQERAKQVVTFRSSSEEHIRTLGEDAVYNTFDFASASVGDALGRELASLFDPALKHTWKKEGKVAFSQVAKRLGGSLYRITLAPMADWFVAVPYTFQQKWQQSWLDKAFPGFKKTADSTAHGSAYETDENGKIKGTYALAGAIDLQFRFTLYNFGTGLFRDLTDVMEKSFKKFMEPENKELHGHVHKTPETMFRAGKNTLRGMSEFLLGRLIKTFVIMTPSIPIFSMMRVPQNRHKGKSISPQVDEGGNIVTDGYGKTVYKQTKIVEEPDTINPSELDRSAWRTSSRIIDKTLNPFGVLANNFGNGLGNFLARFFKSEERKKQAREFGYDDANAILAYTPYIWLKNELDHKYNEPLDKPTDRIVGGIFNRSAQEFWGGIRDVWNVIRGRKSKEEKTKDNPLTVDDIVKTPQNVDAVIGDEPMYRLSHVERHAQANRVTVRDILYQEKPENWEARSTDKKEYAIAK